MKHVSAGDRLLPSEKCCFWDMLCTSNTRMKGVQDHESCTPEGLGVCDVVLNMRPALLTVNDAQNKVWLIVLQQSTIEDKH